MGALTKELASWLFGFFTIPVVILIVAMLIVGINLWFSVVTRFDLTPQLAFAGGALFVATVIIAGVILFRVVG